ncbi:MAG: lipoyl synthase [Kiritimatiellia bacterium]
MQKLKKPEWLRAKIPTGPEYSRLRNIVDSLGLHTVCREAMCPNIGECWEHGHATLMILGDTCTRNCAFCGVGSGKPEKADPDEPRRAAEAIRRAGLQNVVLTSVTRDDMPDGGAAIWAETIRRVREISPDITVEVLVPDFRGSDEALGAVFEAEPDVFGHNLETVRSLYPAARPQADYDRSLDVIRAAREYGLVTKTAVMLGLGETMEEVDGLMEDAAGAGCGIFYAGQYLQPTALHLPVSRYVTPEEFEGLKKSGLAKGLEVVVSGPLIRSSYYSEEQASYTAERAKAKIENQAV